MLLGITLQILYVPVSLYNTVLNIVNYVNECSECIFISGLFQVESSK
jgi:hypothetical protein